MAWAKFAPIDQQSADRKKAGLTGKGNPWLVATLGEIVFALSRTDTFLASAIAGLPVAAARNERSLPSATPS